MRKAIFLALLPAWRRCWAAAPAGPPSLVGCCRCRSGAPAGLLPLLGPRPWRASVAGNPSGSLRGAPARKALRGLVSLRVPGGV